MLVFSVVSYKERFILQENSNGVFIFAANNTFPIGIFPSGTAFNQPQPVLAAKVGASLNVIMTPSG